MPLLQANKNSTWPSQHCWNLITLQWCKYTNMVIASCMINIHKCIIYHINQNVSADAERYHTFVYVEHTWIYNHISAQFWGSVSASGHGNVKFDGLTRPTRVRIRPASHPKWSLCSFSLLLYSIFLRSFPLLTQWSVSDSKNTYSGPPISHLS